MWLAFFHGESIVFGILLVGLLFWLSALALFVWKWRSIAQHRVQIIIAYSADRGGLMLTSEFL